jgi:hypothetical protein
MERLKINAPDNRTMTRGRFTFVDGAASPLGMWLVRCELVDFKLPSFGSAEFRGNRDGKLDVVFLYASDDPRMDERPVACFARNTKGRMVWANQAPTPHRGMRSFAMCDDGRLLAEGSIVNDFRNEEHIVRDCVPGETEASTGRIYTDRGAFFPSVFNARIVVLR